MRADIIGIFLIIIGMLLVALSSQGGKYAVVGFIGPVPIGFGNDARLLKTLLIVAIAILLVITLAGVFHG